MEPLDLRKFIWEKDKKLYIILAITDFMEYNVVVFRAEASKQVSVLTVDEFMREYTATYQLSH